MSLLSQTYLSPHLSITLSLSDKAFPNYKSKIIAHLFKKVKSKKEVFVEKSFVIMNDLY